MKDSSGIVALSLAIARATLASRVQRRKLMAGILTAILTIFVLGNWPLSGVLQRSLWWMLFWWGGCAVLCAFLVLLALFDALSVVKEEREKMGIGKGEFPEE